MAFSISTAIIFELYHRGEQGRAMGYIGTTVSLASIAGPMMGGYLVDFVGWKYISSSTFLSALCFWPWQPGT
jgi:predicted MFS family arabinose efflux permease